MIDVEPTGGVNSLLLVACIKPTNYEVASFSTHVFILQRLSGVLAGDVIARLVGFTHPEFFLGIFEELKLFAI